MKAVRAIAYSCLLLLCGHTTTHAGWFSYDNYEDCMLGRMKGQSLTMYGTADEACKKEFGVEVSIDAGDVQWEFKSEEISITSASDGPDKYEVTSGSFLFSPKSCEGLTRADFGNAVELRFVTAKASLPFDMKGMRCASALSFKGKYK